MVNTEKLDLLLTMLRTGLQQLNLLLLEQQQLYKQVEVRSPSQMPTVMSDMLACGAKSHMS